MINHMQYGEALSILLFLAGSVATAVAAGTKILADKRVEAKTKDRS